MLASLSDLLVWKTKQSTSTSSSSSYTKFKRIHKYDKHKRAPTATFSDLDESETESVIAPRTPEDVPVRKLEPPQGREGKQETEDKELLCVGTHVSTAFGLGTVVAVRKEDGVVAIELQQGSGLFYLASWKQNQKQKQVEVVPVLVGDHIETVLGRGCVVQYKALDEVYVLKRGEASGGEEEEGCFFQVSVRDVVMRDGRTFGRRWELLPRSRSLSESSTSSEDGDLRRRTRPRLSSTSSSNGLTLLKSIASTSYTFIASKYLQGQPVITKFGAGHIVAVDPQRGSAQIQLVWGATAFLNADMIDFYPKALEGTDVHTKFGSGIVIGLRPADAIYTVRLHDVQPVGKSDVVFVHESDLHRSRKIAVTAANVRDRLKAMAHRCFGERIVVAHQSHDEEPNSAGI
uniref:Uncharacterized protein n=1 Tax=Hyaloperonospora arabidopsidis (strain Emoy2) TaxID=559515 RepID=M4BNL6_HYAAE